MMWPPSRSSARSASSRFTGEPARSSPSEVRRSVSCIASARERAVAHARRGQADAVDGDRVAIGDLARQRRAHDDPRAVVGRVDRRDRAVVLDEAGEHAHHSRRRAVSRTSSPICRRRSGSARAARRRSARRPRRPRGPCRRRRAASARRTGAPRRSRPASRNAPARCGPPSSSSAVTGVSSSPSCSSAETTRAGSFSPVAVTTSRSGHLERLDGAARRRARDDDDQRHLGRVGDELRVERKPCGGVEDDAARLAVDAVDARGQARVVGERRADPDDDRVDLGAPVVRELAALLARRSTASRRRASRRCRRGSSPT